MCLKRREKRGVEFEAGDFVWTFLTKDRFCIGKYNKLDARKIGLVEIIDKINPYAYRLKLPSHITTYDMFNVNHLVSFHVVSSNEDINWMTNSLQHGED
jgi:hypothetical protein